MNKSGGKAGIENEPKGNGAFREKDRGEEREKES